MANWINLLDCIYPVGSIYMSISPLSPASIVGGTWSAVTAGATLLAAGADFASDSYGGSLRISTEQMPSHSHKARTDTSGVDEDDFAFTLNRTYGLSTTGRIHVTMNSSSSYVVMGANTSASDSIGIEDIGQGTSTATTGNGEDFHPYGLNVYMWKRTA